MKNINNYNQYIFESAQEMVEIFNDADILESIVTDSESLLKSIEAEEVDIYTTFHINPDLLKSNFTINELYDNVEFNKALEKNNFKKNELESTDETETFIEDTIHVKFFSIYKKSQSELDQPKYIIYQSKTSSSSNWDNVKAYKVNGDMTKFYNKLTNKSIEIKKGDKTYIYNTSNSGNDWQLNGEGDGKFKEFMSNDDIKAILVDDDVSITINA